MSDSPRSTVEITLLGQSYTFRCAKGEAEGLQRAARYLDKALAGVKQRAGGMSDEKVALMTALNITHELLQALETRGELEEQASRLGQRIDTALAKVRLAER
ncbi:cell division protein ZapA [Halotalea alkalilenta]|uniref:cell division protein ZapA n=1 Tax=Halotalea alkalilenta TaxID=376489 RepID=UPI0004817B19|nr:cell division protein ZapA [Halotalea alkalilenta]